MPARSAFFNRALALFSLVLSLALSPQARSNPHWDSASVPLDLKNFNKSWGFSELFSTNNSNPGLPAWRVSIAWNPEDESYRLESVYVENSGTPALYNSARSPSGLGSYRALLRSSSSGQILAHDQIGTGSNFRNLVRTLTFRFPPATEPAVIELQAENPQSGKMELVLAVPIENIEWEQNPTPVQTRLLKRADHAQVLKVNIYAEGYTADEAEQFFEDAQRIPATLADIQFPAIEHLEFRAVFAVSKERLGSRRELGYPIPHYDSFLTLFYPYWNNFGRWYHVVYPTRENEYRRALATEAYDYPIALVNSREYWGVGNFMELTAIPSRHPSFNYLLLHELGHFFGLNEEYNGGGRTELEFAAGIDEPWSQNMTFLPDPRAIKWQRFVPAGTPIPTPSSYWSSNPPRYGAYQGGYADSLPVGHSHKPGLGCVMDNGRNFCEICKAAIVDVIAHDLGRPAPLGMPRFFSFDDFLRQ